MSQQLAYSMFQDVLFPPDDETVMTNQQLSLQKVMRYRAPESTLIRETDLIIFDLETTGLDTRGDHIIEIGALKVCQGNQTAEFSTLVKPPTMPLPKVITKITGITNDMLEGQPDIESMLPEFLSFIDGCILVAHNADFDMSFLYHTANRLGYQVDWPGFCTLKLARALLPDLESKKLDTLAEHYGLTFEARHRSIGDCKVTHSVLNEMITNEGQDLITWADMMPFRSSGQPR